MSVEPPEPDFADVELDDDKRAQVALEEAGGLPDGSPFTAAIEQLRENGESWGDVLSELDAVYDAVDAAALEEGWSLIPKWRVATVEADNGATSGQRNEYYERVAETAGEAETMVEDHTGSPVDPAQTEQVGVEKVA